MKKIVFISLLFISTVGFSQITIDSNPYSMNPAATTVITVQNSQINHTSLFIYIPDTNTGTVKINTESSDMTNAVTYPAGTARYVWITFKNRWYIQFSVDTDTVEVSW